MKKELTNAVGDIYCIVGVYEEINCPYVKWHGYLLKHEVQNACEELLSLIEKQKSTAYLTNNKKWEGFEEHAEAWATEFFVPRLKELGVTHHAAVVYDESKYPLKPSMPFEEKVFDDSDDAREWVESTMKQAV